MSNPLANALSSGPGGITAISNAAQQQTAYNAAVAGQANVGTQKSPAYANKKRPAQLLVHIEQAGNGYIVGFTEWHGEIMDKQVATSIEQVQEIITAEMASRMLEASA